MATVYQLDFFEKDDVSHIKDDVILVKSSIDKVRKCLFARNNELQKKYDDLLLRLDIIERNICRNK